MTEFWIYPLMIVATSLGAIGSVFLKLGSKHLTGVKSLILKKELTLGVSLFTISALLVIIALKFGELSKVFPMTALTYIWVAILSSRVLKESFRKEKIAAFVLIVIGIAFVTG